MPTPEGQQENGLAKSEEATTLTHRGSKVSFNMGEGGGFQANIQLDLKIDLTIPKSSRGAEASLVEGGGTEPKGPGGRSSGDSSR